MLIAQLYNPAGVQLNPTACCVAWRPACASACTRVFNKRAVGRYNPWTVTTYNLSFGMLFLAILQAPAAVPAVLATPGAWPFIIAMAVGPTVAAHGLYVNGLTHVPASNASIISTWEPATAMILAYIVLGETLAGLQLAGRRRPSFSALSY